jgi:superfamily II DNA helicase RecQ
MHFAAQGLHRHAPTGAGKSLLFELPLHVKLRRTVLVITPLKILEYQQTSRLRKMGHKALAVTAETAQSDPAIFQKNSKGDFDVVYVTPEMILNKRRFITLLQRSKFSEHLAALIFDEAHCAGLYGGDDGFRASFNDAHDIRSFVGGTCVPFLCMSATFTSNDITNIKSGIFCTPDKASYVLNLGVDRRNLTLIFRPFEHPRRSWTDFQLVVPDHCESPTELSPPSYILTTNRMF